MAKIVFMGTPEFAVPSLQALIKAHEVIGVVTQPDRPAGRGSQVKQSPIKALALEHGIPVFQPEKLRQKDAIATLRAWEVDAYVVAAFGQILPQAVLDIPRYGSINVHGSLLPRWRGAAPIHAAIRAGDEETGITIMVMDAGLDTGGMLSKAATPIHPTDTTASLHDRLAVIGADLLLETLPRYFSGDLKPQAQDESLVSYAPQIEKEEGKIDWSQPAIGIERLVRAFNPWPSTYSFWEGKQVKIHSGTYDTGQVEVGLVAELGGKIAIGTGAGVFYPHELQLEGKKRLEISAFINGHPNFIGSRFDA